MYLSSNINLLNDKSEWAYITWEMEECLQGEHTIHIVYKTYKEIDESIHRKEMIYLYDRYRTINLINWKVKSLFFSQKKSDLKTPKIVGIIRSLLSAYFIYINSSQSTSMTKTFQLNDWSSEYSCIKNDVFSYLLRMDDFYTLLPLLF